MYGMRRVYTKLRATCAFAGAGFTKRDTAGDSKADGKLEQIFLIALANSIKQILLAMNYKFLITTQVARFIVQV